MYQQKNLNTLFESRDTPTRKAESFVSSVIFFPNSCVN